MSDELCQHGTWRDKCALCNPVEVPMVTIPRAQYEALMAAVKAIEELEEE